MIFLKVFFKSVVNSRPFMVAKFDAAQKKSTLHRVLCVMGSCLLAGGIASCTSVPKPQAKDVLVPERAQEIEPTWSASLAPFGSFLVPHVSGSLITFASDSGLITQLDARTGQTLWTLDLKEPLSSGLGSDGTRYSVTTKNNQILTFDAKGLLWKSALNVQSITSPLVAGERVFVLMADRSVVAMDGQTGRLLWTQQKAGDPLTLNQKGVLLAVQDTLIVGFSGRLVGLNPLSGQARFETPIAVPRGVNDLERLVDLVSPVYRFGDMVCVRAFQAQVGCVNAQRGNLLWSRSSNGDQGLSGNDEAIAGVQSNGTVLAWSRTTGEKVFESDMLKYRKLTTPLVLPEGLVISDSTGVIYLMSLKDGRLLNKADSRTQASLGTLLPIEGGFLYASKAGDIKAFKLSAANVKLKAQ